MACSQKFIASILTPPPPQPLYHRPALLDTVHATHAPCTRTMKSPPAGVVALLKKLGTGSTSDPIEYCAAYLAHLCHIALDEEVKVCGQ